MSPNNLPKDPGRRLTPLEDRFLKYGLEDFTAPEVIELLLCHALGSEERRKLTDEITKRYKNLRGLLAASIQELEKIPGMTPHSLLCIRLMREVPLVFLREKIIRKSVLKSSREVFDYLYFSMRDLKKEVLKVLYLDNQSQIINAENLFEGTLDGIHIYPREIEAGALKYNATGLIFVHNHPSGNPEPSKNDKQITRDLVFVGKILQIQIVDHIIIGEDRYFSFADEGLIAKYEDEFSNLRLSMFIPRKNFTPKSLSAPN